MAAGTRGISNVQRGDVDDRLDILWPRSFWYHVVDCINMDERISWLCWSESRLNNRPSAVRLLTRALLHKTTTYPRLSKTINPSTPIPGSRCVWEDWWTRRKSSVTVTISTKRSYPKHFQRPSQTVTFKLHSTLSCRRSAGFSKMTLALASVCAFREFAEQNAGFYSWHR